MKAVLVWHKIRCTEAGQLEHLVEHQALNLNTFSTPLALFLYT